MPTELRTHPGAVFPAGLPSDSAASHEGQGKQFWWGGPPDETSVGLSAWSESRGKAEVGSRSMGRHARDLLLALIPPPRAVQARFVTDQEWEGVVLARTGQTFVARLRDLRNQAEDEEVEIYLDEIAEDDIHLVVAGAVFYWSIGHRTRPGGRERVSRIRFRRLPVWTAQELDTAAAEAAELSQRLGWDDPTDQRAVSTSER